jgi:uncharacterized repeat protein (TIGR03803 family)
MTKRIACVVLLLCAVVVSAQAQITFTTVASLDSTNKNPYLISLVQGMDGNFYGTSSDGGNEFSGSVFRVTPNGALTTLYTFCPDGNCDDGRYPYAGLIQATDGNLYGTTYQGGVFNCGTVFKITREGILTTLYSFPGDVTYCDNPIAGLIEGADRNFYGTTANTLNVGTVFRITPGGTLTTLHLFCEEVNCGDGRYPEAGLIQASDGNFYGTTSAGGVDNCSSGCGTVFRITPTGTLTSVYHFCAEAPCYDGESPRAGLVESAGVFYGTTSIGGNDSTSCYLGSCGTVFKVTSSGSLTRLYAFCSQLA